MIQFSESFNSYNDGAVEAFNFYSPTGFANNAPALGSPEDGSKTKQYGVFVTDQVEFGEDWHGVVGLRWSQISSQNIDFVAGERAAEQKSHALTPMLGVLYDLTESVGVYANVGTGIEPGLRAPPDASNAGDQLSPRRSYQAELGVKSLWLDRRASVDASIFYINRTLQAVGNTGEATREIGDQRHIGGEVIAKGRFWDPLEVTGGVQYLHARVVDALDPASEGDIPTNVAALQGVVSGALDIRAVPGLALTGTLLYVGDRELRQPNDDYEAEAYVRLDAGILYGWRASTVDFEASLLVENALDEEYFYAGFSRSYGSPRTFTLGLNANF